MYNFKKKSPTTPSHFLPYYKFRLFESMTTNKLAPNSKKQLISTDGSLKHYKLTRNIQLGSEF